MFSSLLGLLVVGAAFVPGYVYYVTTSVLVVCFMRDDSRIGGHLAWYNTDTEETEDRDLVLAPPFLVLEPGSNNNTAPEVGRMIISARDILRMHVVYLRTEAAN